ncbi:MAG: HlyC/CorC family transporter [Spirochaetales bacterium]|nr:HlyC/CorC family transporter [Spirochaetales bacterium]
MVVIELFVIATLISINLFFALSEIAFISSKRAVIQEAHRRGDRRAKIVLDFMKKPEKFLSSIQVGITLIGIVSGAFGGITMADDLARVLRGAPLLAPIARELSLVTVVGLITYFTIVLGELFPKSIALRNPDKITLSVIPVMNVFTKIFYPLVIFLSFSTRLILRIFGIKDSSEKRENPIKEIVALTRYAVLNKKINKDQEQILYNAININKIMLHEIMVEKEDIKFLRSDMTLAQAMIEAHIHHHTRYPLLDSATGAILGYINLKDIYAALQLNPQFGSLKSISRDILYFKENDKVIDALPLLMRQFQHIAMVCDADGPVVGLITLEDVIESIIGDIYDEFDLLPVHIVKITDDRFIVGGGVRLKKLNKELSLDLPSTEEILSEWLVKNSHGPLAPEKSIPFGSHEFIIRKMKKGKISELIFRK